jgi:hypothetical protein
VCFTVTTEFCKSVQLTGYANDINCKGRTERAISEEELRERERERERENKK